MIRTTAAAAQRRRTMVPEGTDSNGESTDSGPEGPDSGAGSGTETPKPGGDAGRDAARKASAREQARERDRERRQNRQQARAARHQKRLERKERRRSRPRLKKLRFAFVAAGLSALALVAWIFGVMMAVAQDLPDLEARAQYDRAENSVVYANDGKTPLTTLTGNEHRILLDSEEISPLIKQAVVAIEDERFYEHRGIDFLGIARALKEDILSGSAVQGASTITQQFVKNALEAQGSRTVLEKLREAALAYQIERKWSKDKILTNYLDNIYFGEGAYGIEAAAKTFFGNNHLGCGAPDDRCASQLRVEEAAMLAGMIANPSEFDPATNYEAAMARRNQVLQKMRELGVLELSDSDYQQLLDTSGPAKSTIQPPTEESQAPFFTDWLRQQIVDKYGAGQAFGGGLQIRSTLDLDVQRAAEDAVSSYLANLGPTSAVVVLRNSDDGVLAMVGGDDFDTSAFNLATNGRRQPGSSFKPFTLVTALAQGYSPDKVYASQPVDIPFQVEIKTKSGEKETVTDFFHVRNYGDNYLGSASITTATTYSDNSVYAQLGTDVGPENVVKTAHALGIQSPIPDNPAMILGGLRRGVTPLEMAYAYSTLANHGQRVSGTMASRGNGHGPVAIEKVTNSDGDLVPDHLGANGENKPTAEEAVSSSVADTATGILHTVVTSGTGKNAQVGDDYIWGKTGTTDNNADAWFVGATEDVTVAVWVGYPDGGTPMETEFGGLPVDGGTLPALIWQQVVTAYDSIKAGKEAAAAADAATSAAATTSTTPVAPDVAPTEPAPAPDAAASAGGGGGGQPDTGGGSGSVPAGGGASPTG